VSCEPFGVWLDPAGQPRLCPLFHTAFLVDSSQGLKQYDLTQHSLLATPRPLLLLEAPASHEAVVRFSGRVRCMIIELPGTTGCLYDQRRISNRMLLIAHLHEQQEAQHEE